MVESDVLTGDKKEELVKLAFCFTKFISEQSVDKITVKCCNFKLLYTFKYFVNREVLQHKRIKKRKKNVDISIDNYLITDMDATDCLVALIEKGQVTPEILIHQKNNVTIICIFFHNTKKNHLKPTIKYRISHH